MVLDNRRKFIEEQAKMRARPDINSETQFHESQMLSTKDGKKIVSRLMGYKKRYNENGEELKEKYQDEECTFQPRIRGPLCEG
jgi:hypothetical protein